MLEPFYAALQPDTSASGAAQSYSIANETGTGRVLVCPVFPGAELSYNDMHLAFCPENQCASKNVLELNHCRVGRFECSFGENSCAYLAAGDFAVTAVGRKKSSSCFPLRHYHGITILLDLDVLPPELAQWMEWFGIDLDRIRQYICQENRCCILRDDPAIGHIFSELYAQQETHDPGYLRLKTMELLYILSRLETQQRVQQTDYFSHHQVECAKRIAQLMTQDLTGHRTIEELAQEVGLSPTALKSCFKGVYGSSVYAYLREYRLQTAQKLLAETSLSVADIAHRVGYENPNKFSSAFRAACGVTPTAYRKGCPNG